MSYESVVIVFKGLSKYPNLAYFYVFHKALNSTGFPDVLVSVSRLYILLLGSIYSCTTTLF